MDKIKNEFIGINISRIMQEGYELEGKERESLIKKEHLYYVISDNSHVFIMQLVFRTGISDYIVNSYSIITYHNKGIPKKELIDMCKDLANQWNLKLA
jgi:PleD family two-component response regulator